MKMLARLSVRLVCAVAAAVMVVSCSGGSSGPDIPDQIWPLAVGNTWRWSSARSGEYSTTVSSKRTIANTEAFQLHVTGGEPVDDTLYANLSSGLYTFGSAANPLSSPVLWLKYPAAVGDSWSFFGTRIELMATADSITVGAGTFKCYRYRAAGFDTYFAPRVGFVRSVEVSTGATDVELLGYSVK
ncbi:MAG: hypothetical protein HYV63_02475 [Candidatus Schekmanbacteria bacterium]|nr:hypothetical protein [Candidatus Schekmanbacteria bacterium]